MKLHWRALWFKRSSKIVLSCLRTFVGYHKSAQNMSNRLCKNYLCCRVPPEGFLPRATCERQCRTSVGCYSELCESWWWTSCSNWRRSGFNSVTVIADSVQKKVKGSWRFRNVIGSIVALGFLAEPTTWVWLPLAQSFARSAFLEAFQFCGRAHSYARGIECGFDKDTKLFILASSAASGGW